MRAPSTPAMSETRITVTTRSSSSFRRRASFSASHVPTRNAIASSAPYERMWMGPKLSSSGCTSTLANSQGHVLKQSDLDGVHHQRGAAVADERQGQSGDG